MAAAAPQTYTMDAVKALPANVPSICIPRVFPNITWQRVKSVFEELGFGSVEKVDMVNKTAADGTPIKRVFVHFSSWNNDNSDVLQARHDILNGDFVQVTYDHPWFWRCYQSNVPRPAPKTKVDTKKAIRKPRMAIKGEKRRSPPSKEITALRDEIADLKSLIKEMARDTPRPQLQKVKKANLHPRRLHKAQPPKLTFKAKVHTEVPVDSTDEHAPMTPVYGDDTVDSWAPTTPPYGAATPEYAPHTPVEELALDEPKYGGMPGVPQDGGASAVQGDAVNPAVPVYMD